MDVRLKRFLYALALAVTLGGMIFMTMPVQFMVAQFGLPEKVRVGHLTGTVWSGRAIEVAYQDRLGPLAAKDARMNLAWVWCPGWSLAAMCVRMESPLVKGEGTFVYPLFGGALELSDTRLHAQTPSYPVRVGPLKSRVGGSGEIHLERLLFDPEDARLLTGLRANGAVRGLQAGGFGLGDYLWRASLEESTGVTSDFNGGNDRFTLTGQALLDLDDRSYRYTAALKTEDRGLLELLKKRAKKSGRNTLTFSGSGKLGS